MQVYILESNGKIDIDIEIKGTPHVPVALEMSFREGGKLVGTTPDLNVKGVNFLSNGTGQYIVGDDVINFGRGSAPHKWSQMRGMLPKQEGNSVYITGFTPFHKTITIS